MNELITIYKNQMVTDSLMIAEHFEKEHRHVLEVIRNITAENSAVAKMFYETKYKANNKQSYTKYLMNRDGFSLLVMGFTGQKALEWKLKYIEAFNQMEKERNKKLTNVKTVGGAMRDVVQVKSSIDKLFKGVPESIALVTAFEQVEGVRGIDLSITKALIPADTTEAPKMALSATDVAREAGLKFKSGNPSPVEANKRLCKLGFIEKKPEGRDGWQLTEKGKEYGGEFPYNKGGHSGFEIRWLPSVVELVRNAG